MTVEPSDANAQCAINIYNFTIYAQSNGGDAGSLTAIVNNSKAVTTCAITAYDKITINGGNITARSTNTSNGNLVDHSGIAGSSGLTINGGNIVATSESTVRGCGLSGKITINWNNNNCSLYFYPYRDDGFNGYMKIGDGKTITDGTNTYSGTLTEGQKAAIARKLLTPLTRIVTAKDGADGDYWTTFYHKEAGYHAPDGTTAFMTSLDATGHLTLTALTDGIIPKDQAVILKSTGNPVMTKVSSGSSDGYAYGTNDLQGVMAETTTPANCYTLANGSAGVGFYRYTGANVHAGKAYLVYSGAGARSFYGFGDDSATGIETPTLEGAGEGSVQWYSLDGRRLQSEPAKRSAEGRLFPQGLKKGVYINNGRKVVVK